MLYLDNSNPHTILQRLLNLKTSNRIINFQTDINPSPTIHIPTKNPKQILNVLKIKKKPPLIHPLGPDFILLDSQGSADSIAIDFGFEVADLAHFFLCFD